MTGVQWLTAILDTPAERAAEAESFWCSVTGQTLSPRRGQREEFATLEPADGDAFLRVQTVLQSPPGGMHLDLHTEDVDAFATRAEALGASTSYHERGYVVGGSPGGMTFCVVGPHGTRRPPARRWPGGRSAVDQVCLDIPPDRFDAECAFWAELTGWPLQGDPHAEFARLLVPDGMSLKVLLQRLDDPQYVVTAHLDLAGDDRDAEVGRHLELGAAVVRRTDGWTTLRDPAGRAYCVTRRPAEPA
jgi:hypothetical protein